MEYLRVHIKSMDEEGRGVGQHTDNGGHTYKIASRGAFIGDDVLVRIDRVFKNHNLKVGKAFKFFTKGPYHVERICPNKAPCAACPLHGATLSLALSIKKERLENALKAARLSLPIDEIVPQQNPFAYRQKVKLVAELHHGFLRLGVYVPYTHKFEPAESCPYVHPGINTAIDVILDNLNNRVDHKELAVIKAIIIRQGKHGPSVVVVTREPLSDKTHDIFVELINDKHLVSLVERRQEDTTNSLLKGHVIKTLGPALVEPLLGSGLVDIDSFCQADPVQAELMYDVVAHYLTKTHVDGFFIDGYAGVGGFSRALLKRGAHNIIALEQAQNAQPTLNSLGVTAWIKPIDEAVPDLKKLSPLTGLVLDPPQKGLGEQALAFAQLHAARVALVFCEPASMAKDIGAFINEGYLVERIIPIDFFSGTPHIETVVLLKRP